MGAGDLVDVRSTCQHHHVSTTTSALVSNHYVGAIALASTSDDGVTAPLVTFGEKTMSIKNRTIHAPRLAVAALLCTGTMVLAPVSVAHAEPGNGQGQGQPQDPGQGNPGQGNPGQGNPGQGNPGGGGGQSSDPAGNNGTVKIAPLGDFDSIPNNTPHVGCAFSVEWYGFDEGADIVSTVLFESQAPTAESVISGTDPAQVFVGGDPATGAGTETGLDARVDYTLSFTGEPHPQQGYHVKLTITTPGSIGNDTKSKVFWVEGCAPTGGNGGGGNGGGGESSTPNTPQAPEVLPETATPEQAPEVLPETATPEQAPDVLGEQAFASDLTTQVQPQSQQELPTSVNAGASGTPEQGPVSGATALLGLLLVLLGAVSGRVGWIRARD